MTITAADFKYVKDKLAHDIDCSIWCVDGGTMASKHPCDCGVFEAECIIDALQMERERLLNELAIAKSLALQAEARERGCC